MAISDGTIADDATSATFTGASDTGLDVLGLGSSSNSLLTMVNGDDVFALQRTIQFQSNRPVIQASSPDGYGKVRKYVVFKFPITLADGSVTVDTIRVEYAHSVEAATATHLDRRMIAGSVICRSAFDDFFINGALI